MEKCRILIVEDELITAASEKEILESLGHEVIGMVVSGQEAIDFAEAENPDLVLMDIVLEGEMDGIEAAWKIRDNYNIPVIFVTAKGDKTIFDNSTHNQPLGYIIKPFDKKTLKTNIEVALKKDS